MENHGPVNGGDEEIDLSGMTDKGREFEVWYQSLKTGNPINGNWMSESRPKNKMKFNKV